MAIVACTKMPRKPSLTPPATAVYGPFAHRGKWRVDIFTEAGKYTRDRATETDAIALADEWRRTMDPNCSVDFRDFDGSKRWFLDLLAECLVEVRQNPSQSALAKARTVAQCARAAAPLCDDEELRRKLEKVQGMVDEIMTARKHGIRTSKTVVGAGDPSSPGTPSN